MKRIIIFLVAIIFSLEVLKIYLQSVLAEDSESLPMIQQQISQAKVQNSDLKVKFLHMTALTTIAAEAKKKGFIPEKTIYLP